MLASNSHLTSLSLWSGLGEKEVQMAVALIDHLAGPFEPAKYDNPGQEALRTLIQNRIEGEPVAPAQPRRETAEIIDLMTALKESVERTKQRSPDEVPVGSLAGSGAKRRTKRATDKTPDAADKTPDAPDNATRARRRKGGE
jgi:DNA end-binding protein Ku